MSSFRKIVRSLNKELRPLAKLAYDQGWHIKFLGNGHLRWVPPSGRFVHSSSRVNTQHVVKVVRRDLIRAGLRMDDSNSSQKQGADMAISHVPGATTSLGDALRQAEEAQQEPSKTDPKPETTLRTASGSAVLSVREYAEQIISKDPGRTWSVPELQERIAMHRQAKRDNVFQALAELARSKKVERPQRGRYRWLGTARPSAPASPAHTPPAVPKTLVAGARTGDKALDQDLLELDEALAALARIEALVRKHRAVILQLTELKRLLGVVGLGQ